MNCRWAKTVLACALLVAQHASAQESEPGETGESGEFEEREYHEHVVAFFTGVAHQGARDNGLALGIEYERRLNGSFGLCIGPECPL